MYCCGKSPDACTWSRLNGLETCESGLAAMKLYCQGILGYDNTWRAKYKDNAFMPRGLYHCHLWSNDVRGLVTTQPINPNVFSEFADIIEQNDGLGKFTRSHKNPISGCEVYMWSPTNAALLEWWTKTFPPVVKEEPQVVKAQEAPIQLTAKQVEQVLAQAQPTVAQIQAIVAPIVPEEVKLRAFNDINRKLGVKRVIRKKIS